MVAGVAFAAWLADGTGSGSARARVAEALTTLDASASATPDLYPGGTGDLVLQIANPNPYPVVVSSVTGDGEITSDTSGCDATNHAVTFSDQSGLALAVPGGGSATHVLADAMAMGTSAADACQGATFSVPIAMSGYSGTDGGGDPGQDTTDADEDGFSVADGDCNDANASVNPGAVEVSNEIDDDCDGQVDEDVEPINCDDGDPATFDYEVDGSCVNEFYPDTTACDDGDPSTTNDTWDGIGNCHGSPEDADGDGYTVAGGDCDDANASVYPGAIEVSNGIDDDCDGFVDET
jgi:hypothetical protein